MFKRSISSSISQEKKPQNKRKIDKLTKIVGLLMIFGTISFLTLSTFQWEYDFSSNIFSIRIWQYLLAFFSGGALGASGLLLQKLTRNNLSDISILGIGSLNIIFIIIFILSKYDGTIPTLFLIRAYLPLISIGSSILGTGIVYTLSKNQGNNCEKFAITGIALQFIFEAISVTLSNPNIIQDQSIQTQVNSEIQNFAYGRLPNISELSKSLIWRVTTLVSIIAIIITTLVIWFYRKEVDIIEINEELARFYGIKVKFVKILMYLCIAILVGIESAMVGTISLLGIVAAGFAKLMFGNKTSSSLIPSFIIGGTLVVGATFISVNLNKQIPIGFLSTCIIAPVFIYMLFKKK